MFSDRPTYGTLISEEETKMLYEDSRRPQGVTTCVAWKESHTYRDTGI